MYVCMYVCVCVYERFSKFDCWSFASSTKCVCVCLSVCLSVCLCIHACLKESLPGLRKYFDDLRELSLVPSENSLLNDQLSTLHPTSVYCVMVKLVFDTQTSMELAKSINLDSSLGISCQAPGLETCTILTRISTGISAASQVT